MWKRSAKKKNGKRAAAIHTTPCRNTRLKCMPGEGLPKGWKEWSSILPPYLDLETGISQAAPFLKIFTSNFHGTQKASMVLLVWRMLPKQPYNYCSRLLTKK